MSANPRHFIACEQCDCLYEQTKVEPNSYAVCQRCQAPLEMSRSLEHDVPLALALGALVMLAIAHLNPIFGLNVQGHVQSASIWEAAETLFMQDSAFLSLLVLTTTLLFPALELLAIVYLLLHLRNERLPMGYVFVMRILQTVKPWVMVEVLMLGVLIALVKLSGFGIIILGAGIWSFAAVMLLMSAASATLHFHSLWKYIPFGPGATLIRNNSSVIKGQLD